MPRVNQAGNHHLEDQQAAPAGEARGKQLYKSREMSARRRLVSLILGDLFCFLVFAVLGTSQHGESFDLLYSVWVALPFILGWFLVSPFIGAFRAEIAARPAKMALRTALAWLCAWPVAMFLRWLLVDLAKGTPFSQILSFAIVALVFNMGLLLLWRWPFALNADLRKRGV